MDERKNLKPELKAIYERVMNTQTSATPPVSNIPPKTVPTPSTATPAQPTPSSQPQPVSTTLAQQVKNESSPPQGGTTYTPGTKGFVYTSRGSHPQPVTTPHATKAEHHQPEQKPHVSHQTTNSHAAVNMKMVVLAVIFIFIWTLFWLIFFEILQPATFGL